MDKERVSLIRGVMERVVSRPIRDEEIEDAAREIAGIMEGGGTERGDVAV